jgi:transposase
MKYYTSETEYNCGIDLHSKNMYVCLMNRAGNILVHENIQKNDFSYYLKLVEPYRHDLTVTFESCFMAAWFADLCEDHGIAYQMAHAYYLKTIQGFKHKNDKRDCQELADCLRTNRIPPAYVCPRKVRSIRALVRRRMAFVQNRSRVLSFCSIDRMAHGLPALKTQANSKARWSEGMRSAFEDDPFQKALTEANVATVEHYNHQIARLEQILVRHASRLDSLLFNLLRTIPGIGEVLALTILYETIDPARFPSVKNYISYCRLARGMEESGGKILGSRGSKIGNPYLKWAFIEAAILAKRSHPAFAKLAHRLEKKKIAKKLVNAILAAKIARAAYFMMTNKTAFDPNRICKEE